jgi:hypothetical protein
MPQQIASMVERADAGEPPLSGFGVIPIKLTDVAPR